MSLKRQEESFTACSKRTYIYIYNLQSVTHITVGSKYNLGHKGKHNINNNNKNPDIYI